METKAYFDNSATTKPCARAIEEMLHACTDAWANPSSLYDIGMTAQLQMDAARKKAAGLLGCRGDEIYFTSGGTEANNIAILGGFAALRRRGNRVVTTEIEHPSVLNAVAELEKQGAEVVRLKPGADGCIAVRALYDAINSNTVLVSMMLVNNETGAIQPVEAIRAAVTAAGSPALIHCDCVQAFGKLPIRADRLGVDLISASGHKIHGPKGIGLLYKRKAAKLQPRAFGGGQEQNLRPGTESTPLIAGLYGAMEALPELRGQLAKTQKLRDYAVERLLQTGVVQINSDEKALPYVLNVSVPGLRSEVLLHFLEQRGIYVSSGSACAKGEASYVLRAMGIARELADSAVRISFCRDNTTEEVDRLALAVAEAAMTLKHKS